MPIYFWCPSGHQYQGAAACARRQWLQGSTLTSSQTLNIARYGALVRLFLTAYLATGEPTKLLELYLSAYSRGAVKESEHVSSPWRADGSGPRDFLGPLAGAQALVALGPRLIALWSAAVTNRSVLVSGEGAGAAVLLLPLMGGYPTYHPAAYSKVFPATSPAAAVAVGKGAVPSMLAGVDPFKLRPGEGELLAPAAAGTGRVVGVPGGSSGDAWASRREWWDAAVHLDSGSVSPYVGDAGWGVGGDPVFPSPLHEAVWGAVEAGLPAALSASGSDAVWAFARVWQGVLAKFVVGPLTKVAGSVPLTKAGLAAPGLALPPATQSFLWDAAVALAAGGGAPFKVQGVTA